MNRQQKAIFTATALMILVGGILVIISQNAIRWANWFNGAFAVVGFISTYLHLIRWLSVDKTRHEKPKSEHQRKRDMLRDEISIDDDRYFR